MARDLDVQIPIDLTGEQLRELHRQAADRFGGNGLDAAIVVGFFTLAWPEIIRIGMEARQKGDGE